MRPLSIRAKLTFWYLAVVFGGLLLFSLLSCEALRFALIHVKESSLVGREQRLMHFLEENEIEHTPLSLSEQLQNYAIVTHEGNLFQIRNPDGDLFFPTDPSLASWLSPSPENCVRPVFRYSVAEGQPIAVMCHLMVLNGRLVRIYIGGALDESLHILTIYRNALFFIMPCLFGLSAFSGYLLSRRALHPVDRMTKAAVNIGIANLSQRLPVPPANDEIRHLATAWNQLLDRLEKAISRLSQFSADVSHDLRTSITVILATAQLSLHRDRSKEEYRDDLERIVTECRTASTLLDALLSLARSDNFMHEVAFQRIDICDLVVAGCRRVEDLAESSEIILDWNLPVDPVYVEGDAALLHRLLGILLDNAIKFTPEHGEIYVQVSRAASEVIVTVRDTGIGMSEDVRQHIFDRFYQAELREKKAQAGNGLGLAIAKWIAEAHRAVLTAESAPMKGSIFEIHFQMAPPMYSAAPSRAEESMMPS